MRLYEVAYIQDGAKYQELLVLDSNDLMNAARMIGELYGYRGKSPIGPADIEYLVLVTHVAGSDDKLYKVEVEAT